VSKRNRKPKVACVQAMKMSRGCSDITPLILYCGTKMGCVVNFNPLSHITTVKKPWSPLNRRIARPPEPIWTFWRTEKSPAPAKN